ncbi:hypothetical protein WP4W18C03_37120 [Pseudomonas putida]|nr:hypothetical protein WP4W18C03_37120 [Pseudomonas putida]
MVYLAIEHDDPSCLGLNGCEDCFLVVCIEHQFTAPAGRPVFTTEQHHGAPRFVRCIVPVYGAVLSAGLSICVYAE